MSPDSNAPEKRFRAGSITAAIWANKIQRNGKTVTRHSVRIQKRFRDKQGQWQVTDTYFPDDLGKLRLVVDKAMAYCLVSETKNPDVRA